VTDVKNTYSCNEKFTFKWLDMNEIIKKYPSKENAAEKVFKINFLKVFIGNLNTKNHFYHVFKPQQY
jgi:hypothetical protein